MPYVSNAVLTLTTVNQNTTVNVKYNANFTPFERHLAALGLIFEERIECIGCDPAGALAGTLLFTFPRLRYPVTDGTTLLTIPRNVSRVVTRAALQEDAALGDNDEIRCRIKIAAIGIPATETSPVWTDEQVLVG